MDPTVQEDQCDDTVPSSILNLLLFKLEHLLTILFNCTQITVEFTSKKLIGDLIHLLGIEQTVKASLVLLNGLTWDNDLSLRDIPDAFVSNLMQSLHVEMGEAKVSGNSILKSSILFSTRKLAGNLHETFCLIFSTLARNLESEQVSRICIDAEIIGLELDKVNEILESSTDVDAKLLGDVLHVDNGKTKKLDQVSEMIAAKHLLFEVLANMFTSTEDADKCDDQFSEVSDAAENSMDIDSEAVGQDIENQKDDISEIESDFDPNEGDINLVSDMEEVQDQHIMSVLCKSLTETPQLLPKLIQACFSDMPQLTCRSGKQINQLLVELRCKSLASFSNILQVPEADQLLSNDTLEVVWKSLFSIIGSVENTEIVDMAASVLWALSANKKKIPDADELQLLCDWADFASRHIADTKSKLIGVLYNIANGETTKVRNC